MDLFGRYVFRQTAGALLLILISLTGIVWLATVLKELKLVTAQGQSLWLFLKITCLALPSLMAVIAPVALLVACFHTLNRLNGDSELIVMSASGAPIWRLAKPYILLSLIITGALIVANLYIMPASLQTLRAFIIEVRTDLISQILQPGRFSSPEKGLTFHIRDRDLSDNLLGLVMHDERDPKQIMSYLAEQARIVKKDGNAFLIMHNGYIHRRVKGSTGTQIVAFDQYMFNISQFGQKGGQIVHKPSERYLSELLNPAPDDPLYKRNPGKFRSEIHERFAGQLYPILFALIAVATLGQARTTRQDRLKTIFIGFSIAAALRVCGLAATNLLTLKSWAVILVYGIPISGIIVAAIVGHVRMSPQRRSQMGFGGFNISQIIRRINVGPGRGASDRKEFGRV